MEENKLNELEQVVYDCLVEHGLCEILDGEEYYKEKMELVPYFTKSLGEKGVDLKLKSK